MRFPFDGDPGREEIALVASVLRRDPGGDRLRALEALAGVERLALQAGMQIGATPRTAGITEYGSRANIPAPRASNHLAETGHVGSAALERFPLGFVGACFDSAVPRRLGWRLRAAILGLALAA